MSIRSAILASVILILALACAVTARAGDEAGPRDLLAERATSAYTAQAGNEVGRYTVSSDKPPVVLDTKTGRLWYVGGDSGAYRLVPIPYLQPGTGTTSLTPNKFFDLLPPAPPAK